MVAVAAAVAGKVLVALPTPPTPVVTRQEPVAVGTVLCSGSVKIIDRPGLYGLAEPPAGSSYAIARGNLLRVDMVTGAVQSVLRPWITATDREDP